MKTQLFGELRHFFYQAWKSVSVPAYQTLTGRLQDACNHAYGDAYALPTGTAHRVHLISRQAILPIFEIRPVSHLEGTTARSVLLVVAGLGEAL